MISNQVQRTLMINSNQGQSLMMKMQKYANHMKQQGDGEERETNDERDEKDEDEEEGGEE